MAWQAAERHSHPFGFTSTYSYTQGNVILLDSYSNQYSLNWSTDLAWDDFAWTLLRAGLDDSETLLQRADGELAALLAGQLQRLLGFRPESLGPAIVLVRLMHATASLTWQQLPATGGGHQAVIGVASDRVDRSAIRSYFRATATSTLRRSPEDIVGIAARLNLRPTRMSLLARVSEVAQKSRGPE